MLRVSEDELNDLATTGELRPFRNGDEVNFLASDVTELRAKREEVYDAPPFEEESRTLVTDFQNELKSYFARNPDKLYELTPRNFEILVADIMKDFGFDVELTQQTRDGGRDLYAYFRNQITSFLLFVECKRWTPPNHVGIGVVQRLFGVTQAHGANKGMIVTTSYFTSPAKEEADRIQTRMSLADFDDLKSWLARYK